MFIGIDLGTSGVKVVALNYDNTIVAIASCALGISNPHPLWSEQNPLDWWNATEIALYSLSRRLISQK